MKKRLSSFSIGFLLGVITGAVFSILTAPQSGKETRLELKEHVEDVRNKTEAALEDAQTRAQGKVTEFQNRAQEMVNEMSDEARLRTEKLNKISQDMIADQKKIMERSAKEAAETLTPEKMN